jgi:hypothetical protein
MTCVVAIVVNCICIILVQSVLIYDVYVHGGPHLGQEWSVGSFLLVTHGPPALNLFALGCRGPSRIAACFRLLMRIANALLFVFGLFGLLMTLMIPTFPNFGAVGLTISLVIMTTSAATCIGIGQHRRAQSTPQSRFIDHAPHMGGNE